MRLHVLRAWQRNAIGSHSGMSFFWGISLKAPLRWQSSVNSSHSLNEGGVNGTPSILFFGGDSVSLVVLRMLHQRLQSIHNAASHSLCVGAKKSLVVVCPFLPRDPSELAQRHRRQYPVARYCVEHGIPLLAVDHPTSLARSSTLNYLMAPWRCGNSGGGCGGGVVVGEEEEEYIAGQPLEAFDVAVVVSFRYFLPNALLERLPPTVNMHPSLLPRYRGASPIFAPLLKGDEVGGASVIKLLPRQLMDSGDVLWQQSVPIARDICIDEYFPLVTHLGAAGLCYCLFGGPPVSATLPDCDSDGIADVMMASSKSTECDWPRTFESRWSTAWAQGHMVHFKKDPFHAPLLAKDRALIKWNTMTAEEAYGTWRAFAGGEYFSPTVNATLDKGATPVRAQLLKRLINRAARKIKKVLTHHGGHCEAVGHIASRAGSGMTKEVVAPGSCDENDNASSSDSSVDSSEEEKHRHLHVHLLIGCTFTSAVHPRDIPNAVLHELHELEGHIDAGHDKAAYVPLKSPEPGSAYFPKSVEEMCAVRCREGWFVWSSAALQGSTSQSANLLRKGMAMKTGRLYVSLFVHNDKKGDGDCALKKSS